MRNHMFDCMCVARGLCYYLIFQQTAYWSQAKMHTVWHADWNATSHKSKGSWSAALFVLAIVRNKPITICQAVG